jgi:hypothetical protein
MEPGKPDAVKPPGRFDEGREADGHWPSGLSIRRFPPTLHAARVPLDPVAQLLNTAPPLNSLKLIGATGFELWV